MPCIEYLCNKVHELYSVTLYTMCKNEKSQVWNPYNILQESNNSRCIVMILNRPVPLHFQQSFLLNLWQKAVLRVTVDGGTNRWMTWLKMNKCENYENVAPDLITGDMDSVSEDVLSYFVYKNKNMHVIKTPDQNETDFTKALRAVRQYVASHNLKVDNIIILADTSGRFDQIIGNINTLFKARDILPNVTVILLASNSLTWLLSEGNHRIEIPLNLREKQEWCAVIPIGSPSKVTSTGLKWNLNNTILEFGKLVSTSNTYNGDPVVTIKTNAPVIWSMGIKSLL